MVLRYDHEVLHSGIFCDTRPLVGIERRRVESLVKLVIFLDWNLFAARPSHFRPLERDRAPMNKHSKSLLSPGIDRLIADGFVEAGQFGNALRRCAHQSAHGY